MTLPNREDGASYQFYDLLAYVDLDAQENQGTVSLRLNDEEASYLSNLQEGDRAQITWHEEKEGI